MLSKQSCILRTTSSRSLLIPCEDSDGESTTFCNYGQVTEKSPGPALCSPCKVVIGFDVDAEKKPPIYVCESPRSVLDSSATLSSQDKQQVAARSPRSVLGSLLAAKSGSEENVGAGIEIIVHAPACMVSVAEQRNPNIRSPSKLAAWPAKMSDFDPVDDDICASQGQGLLLNPQEDMEDELLDADISPLRVARSRVHLNEEMKIKSNNANAPKDMNCFCLINSAKGDLLDAGFCRINGGFLDADKCNEQKQSHVNPSKDVKNSSLVPYVNAYEKESACDRMRAPGCTRPPISLQLCKGEGCVIPTEEQFWHHQSIFSASSPPPCPHSGARASPGFLKTCYFCGRPLRLGKDIFMYRGDQPFCSAECRYQKIVLDERKDKRGG